MKRTIIIDNGHGFDTVDKSAVMPTGEIFEEWEFNRIIKLRCISKMNKIGIPFYDLVPFAHDVSLYDRIKKERLLSKKFGKTFLLSIHADAFRNADANGLTVVSSKRQNNSDIYSNILVENCMELGLTNRYDIDSEGLKGRDENFYILRNSVSPSCLIECGFMTNQHDVMKLFDSSFQEKIADCLIKSFVRFQSI